MLKAGLECLFGVRLENSFAEAVSLGRRFVVVALIEVTARILVYLGVGLQHFSIQEIFWREHSVLEHDIWRSVGGR